MKTIFRVSQAEDGTLHIERVNGGEVTEAMEAVAISVAMNRRLGHTTAVIDHLPGEAELDDRWCGSCEYYDDNLGDEPCASCDEYSRWEAKT